MAALIPTPIIDRNGKATTVHRRSGKAPGARSALAGVGPSVAPAKPTGPGVVSVKLKTLPEGARALRVAGELAADLGFGSVPLDVSAVAALLADRGARTVEVPEDTAYDFLRLGIRLDGAALLTEIGVTPEAAAGTDASDSIRGSFAVASENYRIYRKNTRVAADRMQEAGIPVAKASKALENGLQDEHFDQALDVDQLVKLFNRWHYKAVAGNYEHDRVRQDDVMTSFVNGTIAFQFHTANMSDLKGVQYDVRTMTTPSDPMYEAFANDRALVDAVVGKLLASPRFMGDHGYNPVTSLYHLVDEKGEEVLDLDRTGLARKHSVDTAKFIEEVFRTVAATDNSDGAYWRHSNMGEVPRTFMAHGDYVQLWHLELLHDAGLTPQQAHDDLIVRRLTVEQSIAAHRDGIASSLADGAL